ncbi:MAG: fumarylacetoacetate hydrolase family protein [Ectothiorhodospiraceae bacterium]|nr:fumarylacetoacetate hydrolase family protein [Ectothiorhodospiraceae bacterium]
MRFVRYRRGGKVFPGMLDREGTVHDLSGLVDDLHADRLPDLVSTLAGANIAGLPAARDVEGFAAPIAGTGKIIGIGLNYVDHARESGAEPPEEPIMFTKATSAISGPYDPILLPPGSEKLDWEVELGVVIGRSARRVQENSAMAYVLGYTIVNDVSERAWQLERGGQWVKGKSADSFAPMGPWLVTADEISDPQALRLSAAVNGTVYQDGTTADMIFPVRYLVSYVSQFMTLQPGDVICTGTPAGVGMGQKPPRYLKPGDRVRLEVEGLGHQEQEVVAPGE